MVSSHEYQWFSDDAFPASITTRAHTLRTQARGTLSSEFPRQSSTQRVRAEREASARGPLWTGVTQPAIHRPLTSAISRAAACCCCSTQTRTRIIHGSTPFVNPKAQGQSPHTSFHLRNARDPHPLEIDDCRSLPPHGAHSLNLPLFQSPPIPPESLRRPPSAPGCNAPRCRAPWPPPWP